MGFKFWKWLYSLHFILQFSIATITDLIKNKRIYQNAMKLILNHEKKLEFIYYFYVGNTVGDICVNVKVPGLINKRATVISNPLHFLKKTYFVIVSVSVF